MTIFCLYPLYVVVVLITVIFWLMFSNEIIIDSLWQSEAILSLEICLCLLLTRIIIALALLHNETSGRALDLLVLGLL